jgi:hypothetical protein
MPPKQARVIAGFRRLAFHEHAMRTSESLIDSMQITRGFDFEANERVSSAAAEKKLRKKWRARRDSNSRPLVRS